MMGVAEIKMNGTPLSFDKEAMILECCKCGLTHCFVLIERDGKHYLKVYVDEAESEAK